MRHFTLGQHLPRALSKPLFGDRKRFGLEVQKNDPCWQEWEERSQDFYEQTQKQSVGAIVNKAGYTMISRVDLSTKRVLEIGPGNLDHIPWWKGRPECYVIVDVNEAMLRRAEKRLKEHSVDYERVLVAREDEGTLPFEDQEFDVIVSFYSLEHLYPLSAHVKEMLRILRQGGILVGAVPCEGGIGWGLGRMLTSRRWLKRHTSIDPDKIICWEHPNFVDHILDTLNERMLQRVVDYWPLRVPLADLNLVVKFVYEKG